MTYSTSDKREKNVKETHFNKKQIISISKEIVKQMTKSQVIERKDLIKIWWVIQIYFGVFL